MIETGRREGSRIDDIEVLRAFAVGLVLVQHTRSDLIPFASGQPGLLYGHLGFWSGVDLFFAISGFVIARSLLPLLRPATDWRAFVRTTLSFWMRRAWRLLPAAWLWLAIAVAASAVFNRSGVFGPLHANVSGAVAAIFYYANIHEANAFGRYPTGAAFHYWSLSLEEQFYFLLPFLVLLSGRRLPLVLAVIIGAQLFQRRVGFGGDLLLNFLRSDALAFGVLLATWTGSQSYRRLAPPLEGFVGRVAQWISPLLLVAGLCAVSSPKLANFPWAVGAVAVFSAFMVWIASYDRDYLFPPGRVKRALQWAGARSYGIYLIHIPIFFATREFWFRVNPDILQASALHAAILFAGALSAVLVLAEVNYRFVETPLRRLGARFAERIRNGRSAPTESLAPGRGACARRSIEAQS